MTNLSTSTVHRQNILNNKYAVEEIQKALGINGVIFEEKVCFTKKQIADFYEIDERTIDRYLEKNKEELNRNGYEVLKGKKLSGFKKKITEQASNQAENNSGHDINVVTKTTVMGIFDFRSFLNLGMLLTESENARQMRSIILDVTIDTINQKTGGSTKYINQREEHFLMSSFKEENYRKNFTDALHNFVDMGPAKFAIYTNKIYKSIFKENAKEYREILKLNNKDSTRATFYAEILDMISAYENGLATAIENKFNALGRKLYTSDLNQTFKEFVTMTESAFLPLLTKCRQKMASRDLCFRDALHKNIEDHITDVPAEDFEKFLGEKSKELTERIKDSEDVFKRLKER